MFDQRLYLDTLSEFTRGLLAPYDVQTVIDELADRVSEVLGLSGSGVSLARDGRLTFGSALPPAIAELEKVQEARQTGPCVAALQSGEVVAVSDLATERARWPEYCRMAEQVGIVAAAAIPMRLDNLTVGALDLYADQVRDWSAEDLAAARVMADLVTVYLINASHDHKQVELNEQLQHALDSRVRIEQAKGMLAARNNTTPEDGFDRMRRHARSNNLSVREVAESVIALGLDL